jgi:hypothetical protein
MQKTVDFDRSPLGVCQTCILFLPWISVVFLSDCMEYYVFALDFFLFALEFSLPRLHMVVLALDFYPSTFKLAILDRCPF